MKRSTGLFLLAVGVLLLLLCAAGLVIAIGAAGNQRFIVGLWVLFGVAGTLLTIAGIRVMRGERPIGATPTPVNGRVGNYRADGPETRQHSGQDYEVHYKQPVKDKYRQPSVLIVRIPASTPTTLQFNDENWFDRWSKRMGIAREHQAGDETFDNAIYIRGPSHGYAEDYLKDPHRRAAILALRQLGFPVIRLTGTHAEVEWKNFDPATQDQPELVERAVDELRALAHDAPRADPDDVESQSDPQIVRQGLLWGAAVLYALAFFAVFVYTPIHESELIVAGLAVFVVVYPAFGWIAAYSLCGTSTSHDRWAKLMSVGILLIGFGSVGMVALINGAGDDTPADDRTADIVDTRIKKGRKSSSRTYYATVRAWDEPGGTIEFRVSSSEYKSIAIGRSKLELKTFRGTLGIEWFKSKRVRP